MRLGPLKQLLVRGPVRLGDAEEVEVPRERRRQGVDRSTGRRAGRHAVLLPRRGQRVHRASKKGEAVPEVLVLLEQLRLLLVVGELALSSVSSILQIG